MRATPAEAIKAIVAWDIKRGSGENPARSASFRREFEFEAAGKRHWIPVFETGDAARFLKAGEQVEVYLVKPSEAQLRGAVYVRGIKHGYDRVPYPLVNDKANEEAIRLGQAAQAAMKRVDECLARFAREQPTLGVPPTLAALGHAGTDCLEPAFGFLGPLGGAVTAMSATSPSTVAAVDTLTPGAWTDAVAGVEYQMTGDANGAVPFALTRTPERPSMSPARTTASVNGRTAEDGRMGPPRGGAGPDP